MGRVAFGLALALAGVVVPAAARADDAACVSAAEDGQRARAGGKLLSARERFLSCSAETCPVVVRRDCTKWAQEVLDSMPTIVVDAKDGAGHDVGDVTVKLDGQVVATKLDGKGIAVDPGPHELRFERLGSPPVVEKDIIKENAKGRIITVTFADGTSKRGADAKSTEAEHEPRSHSVAPWILVGAGVAVVAAGIVVVASTPTLPANCDGDTEKCSVPQGSTACTGPGTPAGCYDLAADQDQAGKAKRRPPIGYGLAIGGGLLIAAGLVWHFLEPTGPEKSTAIAPWLAPGAGGVAASGRF
jgi:hypothetical protein